MTNIETTENAEAPVVPRRPGRRKGSAKPPGSGRKPGTPNRVTKDIREAMQKRGPMLMREMLKLAMDPDKKVRQRALEICWAYAWGRPTEWQGVVGKDGNPVDPAKMDDNELADLLVQALVHDKITPEAAQAVNDARPAAAFKAAAKTKFLMAQAGVYDRPSGAPDTESPEFAKAVEIAAAQMLTDAIEKSEAPAEPEPEAPPKSRQVWMDEHGNHYSSDEFGNPINARGQRVQEPEPIGYRTDATGMVHSIMPRTGPPPRVVTGRKRGAND